MAILVVLSVVSFLVVVLFALLQERDDIKQLREARSANQRTVQKAWEHLNKETK